MTKIHRVLVALDKRLAAHRTVLSPMLEDRIEILGPKAKDNKERAAAERARAEMLGNIRHATRPPAEIAEVRRALARTARRYRRAARAAYDKKWGFAPVAMVR